MDSGATPPVASGRLRRFARRALLAALLGAAAGVAIALLDPVIESDVEEVPFSGPIHVRIVDASGDVEQYGPPTVEVTAVGGTVAFEQYATLGPVATGLSWREDEPLVATFRPWDPGLEAGLTATMDLAPLAASLRETTNGTTFERHRVLLVDVEVGTTATTMRIRLDGDVLLEETIARQDWRSQRTAAAEACASELGEPIAATLTGIADVSALLETWYGRSLSYVRWVAEMDRGLQLTRRARSALPTDDPRLTERRGAVAWMEETGASLDALESALLALRSASAAEAEGRFVASFAAVGDEIMSRLVPLRDGASPLLWCAAP